MEIRPKRGATLKEPVFILESVFDILTATDPARIAMGNFYLFQRVRLSSRE